MELFEFKQLMKIIDNHNFEIREITYNQVIDYDEMKALLEQEGLL